MRYLAILLLLVACTPIAEERAQENTQSQQNTVPQSEIIAQGLDTPWAIDFLPDGSMIITERPGRVRLLSNGSLRTIGEIAVVERGESGLLGIAVDPEFAQSKAIYLYYTDDDSNCISRFTLAESLQDEQVILDDIPASSIHDGGKLKFGPDGKLYATTGDAGDAQRAQQLTSLAGKILRMNKDGSVPEDNPFGSLIWSYGHRNPEGLAWHPQTGVLYSAEHGPQRHDEINRISAGENYGWPEACGGSGEQPLRCYTEMTLAPGGIAILGNDLYVAGLRGQQLRQLKLGADGSISAEEEVISGRGRIREVVARDGFLYITTSNHDGRGNPREGDDQIIRIRPVS